MLKIVTEHKQETPAVTTLNDIPNDTVFSGSIVGVSGYRHTGLFYKASGTTAINGKDHGDIILGVDVIVVRLGECPAGERSDFHWCRVVENYKPYPKAELRLNDVHM